MSDVNLERLVASLELRTDNFEKSLAKIRAQSQKHTAEMAGDFHKLTEAVIETGRRVGETFGLSLGAAALYEAPKQIMEIVRSVGELKTAAERAGVSIEELQKLNFAAIGTGLGQDQLVEMMGQFNKRIGEAATKGGDLKKLLDANGVSLRNSNGEIRSASDLLGDIADLVKNTRSDQEATVIATMAFGRAGADLLGFLRQGKEEIAAAKKEAEDLGAVIGRDVVGKADEFDKKWSQTWTIWKTQGKAAIAELGVAYLEWAQKQMLPDPGFRAGRTVGGKFVPVDELPGMIHPEDPGRVDLPGGLGPRTIVPGPTFGPNLPPAGWKSAYDQQVEGLQKHIAAIQAETAAFGQSAGAIARAKAEQEALSAIKAKDGTVTDAETQGLQKYLDQLQQVVDAQEKAAKQQKAIADATQDLTSGAQDFVHTLIEGGDALKSLQSTLLKILENIIDANLFGSGPFAGMFGTQGQNGMPGGVIGNLLTSAFRPSSANSNAPAALPVDNTITQGPLSGFSVHAGSSPVAASTAVASWPTDIRRFLIGSAAGRGGADFSSTFGSRLDAFLNAAPDHGISVFSGYRSVAHQQELWDAALKKYGSPEIARRWVAPPGHSQHNFGNAADLQFASPEMRDWAHANAANFGLKFRMGNEPWHIEPMPGRFDPKLQSSAALPAEIQQAQQQIAETATKFSSSFDASLKAIPAATTQAGGNFTTGFGDALQSILSSLGSGGLPLGGNIGSLLSPLLGGGGKLASGGFVSGPGSSTSDSIPARLSNGEFVVNAEAAKQWAPLLKAINDNKIGVAAPAAPPAIAVASPPIPRLPVISFPTSRAATSRDGPGHSAYNVVVNNHHAGADISQRMVPGQDGSPQLEIAVREIDQRMAKKYGLQPVMRRRG